MKPSSKNTKSGSHPNLPAVVPAPGHLARGEEPSLVNSQIATLQGQLVEEQDQRKEERFLWFAACGLLFDVLTFMAAGVPAGTIVTLVYVALLMVLSRRWGFEGFAQALHDVKAIMRKDKDDGGEEA